MSRTATRERTTKETSISIALDVDGTGALHRLRAPGQRDLPDAGVELGPRHGAAVVGQRAPGPRQQQLLAEAGRPQAPIAGPPAHPVAELQPVELGDRARCQAVAARLVPWEDGGVG